MSLEKTVEDAPHIPVAVVVEQPDEPVEAAPASGLPAAATAASTSEQPSDGLPPGSDEPIDDELFEETQSSLFLRAIFTLLAGSFLIYAQHRAPLYPHQEWHRWIGLSVISNLLLPLGIVWLFFGQGLRHVEEFSDQKFNAWGYGWNFRNFRRHLLIALVLTGLMLPILYFASRDAGVQIFYRLQYYPITSGATAWLWLMGTLVIYMFCWEWFHRGFLLFGMAQGFGPVTAIILQAVVFGMAHLGKPPLEMASSFAGGFILGVVAWHEKSFVPAFLTHSFIHIIWTLLMLL